MGGTELLQCLELVTRTGDHLDQDVLLHRLMNPHDPFVVHLRADPD